MSYSKIPAVLFLALASVAPAQFAETFTGVTPGIVPPLWQDAGLLSPTGVLPIPSATVITTTGPNGQPTQALSIGGGGIGYSQGIYRTVPVAPYYRVSADLRVSQFSNFAGTVAANDWPVLVGVSQLTGANLALSPAVQIYASTATREWRVFVAGTATNLFFEYSLNVPVLAGIWYRVELELTVAAGLVRTRIWNLQTAQLLDDQTQSIVGWTPAEGAFNAVAVLDGEPVGAVPAVTVPNIAMADNITFGTCASGQALTSDFTTLTFSTGGTQTLCLDAGASHAGEVYLLAGTASGTAPGFSAGGFAIPLNVDAYTLYLLQNPVNPFVAGMTGILDANGRATATVTIPMGVIPAFPGLTVHHLFATANAQGLTFVSNAAPLNILP